jgi:sortase A
MNGLRGDEMPLRRFAFILLAFVLVAALPACGSLVQSGGDGAEQQAEETQQVPTSGEEENAGEGEAIAEVPEDETLALQVPKLDINIEEIPTERGDNTQALTDNAAVHLLYTGFPWEEEANVYLAGHVEGYEGTPSYKAFEGLEQLENGDEIIVTDANGTEYNYEVFEKVQVDPTAVEYLDPIPGKNIVTLQTCELVEVLPDGTPNYSDTDRLIVRGELVES